MKKETTKKVKAGKITIDDLAVMVAKGFDGVREEMNEHFNKVENRLGKVEDRLEKVEDRLGKVEDRLEKVEDNLSTTRMDVLGIGDKFVSKHEFNQHLIRFDLLEQKVKTKR